MLLPGCLIFIATLVLVITRPRSVPEWLAALGGGAGMLLLGIVILRHERDLNGI